MKENIEVVCIHCMDKMKEDWQKRNRDLRIKVGDSVKIQFTEKDDTEHMWVLITKINGNDFCGRLTNRPVSLKKYKFGQNVMFPRKDIEDWKAG